MTQRKCGPCSACCTSTPVVPFNKAAGVHCEFETRGETPARGCCSRYDSRPSCCSIYRCGWLNGIGGDDDRPDISGVIVETGHTEDGRIAMACLVPAPGFDERSPGFVAAVDEYCERGVIVTTPTAVYATEAQYEWLRGVTMRFADGVEIKVGSEGHGG